MKFPLSVTNNQHARIIFYKAKFPLTQLFTFYKGERERDRQTDRQRRKKSKAQRRELTYRGRVALLRKAIEHEKFCTMSVEEKI